jgi:feruloyl-CoA synthase
MNAGFHDVDIINFPIEVIDQADGSQIVKCIDPLEEYAIRLTDRLEYWAEQTPDRVFVSRRTSDSGWKTISYSEALAQTQKIASNLLQRELSTERPIMILSGNSIEHLLLMLGAMYIGVPVAPISPAYSLVSTDYGKLKHAKHVLSPGMIFADDLQAFEKAIRAIHQDDTEIVTANPGDSGLDSAAFDSLIEGVIDPEIFKSRDRVTGSTIAKFLFTSGSTGMPKAVINTQEMLCANQVMIRSVFKFVQSEPPVLVDWLPWNHTFGGNHNVGITIYNGGSLYIDDGKPTPSGMKQTIENLKDVSPNVYFNVPKGYELLVEALEQDEGLATQFFKNLQMTFFAGAGLSQHVWDRLDELSVKYTGKKIPMMSGLGATETAPSALFSSVDECASGVIGTPCPGVTLKLIPNGDKTEIRVKGVTITPGYWRNAEQTEKAFDDDDFYCLGDAVKYIDPNNPQRGFRFDGRVSEDFKLNTGTWVSVGTLRAKLIETFAPLAQDVVITGHNEAFIGALVFPNLSECEKLIGKTNTSSSTLLSDEKVRQAFQERLNELADQSTGSSTRVNRMILLTEPPSIDRHEITDKGSINQRAVLKERGELVNDIYSEPTTNQVITVSKD